MRTNRTHIDRTVLSHPSTPRGVKRLPTFGARLASMFQPAHWRLQAFLIALLTASVAHADPGPLDGLDPYVKAAMIRWQVPGAAIAVVKDGKVVAVRGYGRTRSGGRQPVSADTVFPLASITKNFTATALGKLVEAGKLHWDDPVIKHLPEFQLSDKHRTEHTTIRDLLCHRTGLERGDALPRRGDVSREEIVRRVRHLRPSHGFREKWQYHNLMYYVAGSVVGRVAESSWEEYVAAELLGPLGMTRTRTSRRNLPAGSAAWIHRLIDGKAEATEWSDRHLGVSPAGSMHSTAADMSKWLLAALSVSEEEPSVLKPATRREMQALHMSIPVTWDRSGNPYAATFYGWGLGWTVLDHRGRKLCYHAGSTGTMCAVVPEERLGVVILTGMDWSSFPGMLMYDVIDAYLAGPKHAWDRGKWEFWEKAEKHPDIVRRRELHAAQQNRKRGTKPTISLKRFAGSYGCDLYGSLEVTHEADKLLFTFGKNGPTASSHWDDNAFYIRRPIVDVPTEDWIVRFQVEAGKPVSLTIDRIGWHESMPVFRRAAAQHHTGK